MFFAPWRRFKLFVKRREQAPALRHFTFITPPNIIENPTFCGQSGRLSLQCCPTLHSALCTLSPLRPWNNVIFAPWGWIEAVVKRREQAPALRHSPTLHSAFCTLHSALHPLCTLSALRFIFFSLLRFSLQTLLRPYRNRARNIRGTLP